MIQPKRRIPGAALAITSARIRPFADISRRKCALAPELPHLRAR